MKINQITQTAAYKLQSLSDTPLLDAELLLIKHLKQPRTYLRTWPEKEIPSDIYDLFQQDLNRRLHGEPIAYILGYQEFWGISLKVSPATLIPRADTETLVEAILDTCMNDSLTILDLGTGTGAITAALALERPSWQLTAIESSSAALSIAQENLAHYLNTNCLLSNWYQSLSKEKQFDVIVSNPPYIDHDDPHLCNDVRQFEPTSALISSKNGLADIEHIISNAKDYLKPGGKVFLEHGFQQADAVCHLFKENCFIKIKHQNDLSGHIRVTHGTLGD